MNTRRRKKGWMNRSLLTVFLALVTLAGLVSMKPAAASTRLGIQGTRFTLNGKPTFLQGMSYFSALGAPRPFITRDLSDLRRLRFNWIRVFTNWNAYHDDLSAVDKDGRPRQPFIGQLQWLVARCDRQGMIVDVTLSREAGTAPTAHLGTTESLQRAALTVVHALRRRRNWYLDLANERNVGDARFVGFDELHTVREAVRQADLDLLVTASNGGDIGREDLVQYLKVADVDFICPHRPRDQASPAQTLAKTREYLAWMKAIGRVVPVLYQEPLRRGYTDWQPGCEDLLTDATEALKGGAAGWLLHNGGERSAVNEQPRRSFDMRQRRLFEQLDSEERCAADHLHHRLEDAARAEVSTPGRRTLAGRAPLGVAQS